MSLYKIKGMKLQNSCLESYTIKLENVFKDIRR